MAAAVCANASAVELVQVRRTHMKAVLSGTEDTYILVLTGEPVDWRQT